MVRMRALASFLLGLSVSSSAAINGTALVVTDHILKVNTATNQWDTVISKSDFASYNTLGGPCFSPDGRRVAYSRYQLNTGAQDGTHILIADNDGNNITDLCMVVRAGGTFNGGVGNVFTSWASDGYVYWSEDDDKICRVNVTTKLREIVATRADFTGDIPPAFVTLKVSLDGTRAGCMGGGSNGAYGLDLTTKVSRTYGVGCQGTVSPNGQKVTHNLVGVTVGGSSYSYHQVAWIHDFSTGNKIDTMLVVGAVPGTSGSLPRFVAHRFSHSSNDHVLYSGEDALTGKGFVHRLSTNETYQIGTCRAIDYWDGTLPAPPAAAPRIALDSSALHFVSQDGATPPSKTVTVTNSGVGTLTNVTVQGAPAWLTVVRSGSGNTQILTNTVSIAGLQPGVYNATVTVSGGGASNSVNYAVSLNVARSLLAPSGLTASPSGATSAALAWTDNTSSENGFVIQRKAGTGAWTRRFSAVANAVAWTDTGLIALVMYHYRVAAFAGADTSAWSNEDSLSLGLVSSITVTSPSAGGVWRVGDTVHIRWTAQNVAQVDLSYSTDGGETPLLVVDRAIAVDDPDWGDFTWVVPALSADSIMIRVAQYGATTMYDWSPNIALRAGTAINARKASAQLHTGILYAGTVSQSAITVRFASPVDGPASMSVVRLDGTVVAATTLTARAGVQSHEWRFGTSIAPSALLLQLRCAGRTYTQALSVLR